jgi:hypothetical protein
MTKGNGNGKGLAWDGLGEDVRNFMSQNRQHGPGEEEGLPPPDPRSQSDFRDVWDAVATSPATARIIEYINGRPCDPIPTLTEIVAAFYRAGQTKAIWPEQISTVIAICGGQMSRHINLRNDVIAEWGKLHYETTFAAQMQQEARNETGVPYAQSVGAFIRSQKPPEYLVEPLIQRASLYTLTALTSHGKTAVLLYIALCIASGRPVAGKHTVKGRVVWFAGENPSDFAQKIYTACEHWGIDPDELDMVVLAGAFDLASMPQEAVKMAAAGGETALVVIDTSAAYRFDDDEDSNANAITWARMLRQHFPVMPGRPAVIIATHPTKHADCDNLLPRGGGAFLNEVDGNLTLWADEEQNTTTLHWCGKLRGMSFCPLQFALQPCPHPTWTFKNGDPVLIKLAVPAGDGTKPRPTGGKGGRPDGGKAFIARKILADLLVTEGQYGYAPANLPAVSESRWREEFYSRACVEDAKTDTKLKSFQRTVDRLLTAETIAKRNEWVWLIHPEVE